MKGCALVFGLVLLNNDLLFAQSSTLFMSEFGNLAELEGFSKDGMFLSNAIEEIADGVLLSGLDNKDDLRPFLNCEVDDAFGASIKSREDADANSVKGRCSPFSMFISGGGEDLPETLGFMNMVAKLDSSNPSDDLDMQSMGLSSTVKETLPSDPSEECVLPCHDLALLEASELNCLSLTALDLTHVDAADALCAMHPCSTTQSAVSEPAASPTVAMSLTQEAHLGENLCGREALSLCSADMTANSSVSRMNSPVTSSSSTVSFRSSDGGPIFNMMLRGEGSPSRHCVKARAIMPQLPARVLGVEAIRSAFGLSSVMQPQNSTMQRSRSSHALGQLTISSQVQGSCNDDEFDIAPTCKQEAHVSDTSSVSFFTPYQPICNTQGLPDSSPIQPVRRVCSTGDLQAFHGMKKFYGGNPDNVIAEEVAGGKIGHYTIEERKMKLHRYRQKRTERNFSKKIKYACRKTLADSRPRVRGRFARTDETGESSLRGSDLPLIDEYEEVTSHRPRIVHDQHAYLMASNSCIRSSNPFAHFWSTAGMKVAM